MNQLHTLHVNDGGRASRDWHAHRESGVDGGSDSSTTWVRPGLWSELLLLLGSGTGQRFTIGGDSSVDLCGLPLEIEASAPALQCIWT